MHEKPEQTKVKTHEKPVVHTNEEKPSSNTSNTKEESVKEESVKEESVKEESVKENEEVLGKARMREDVAGFREKMLVAESAYLRVLRLRKSGNPTEIRKGKLSELRDEYDQSRANFANKVNESVRVRLSEKNRGMAFNVQNKTGETITKKVSYTEKQKSEVERRYRRMVLTRDIVDRAHQNKMEAQQHESGNFMKVLGWYSRMNNSMDKKIVKLISKKPYESLSTEEKRIKLKKAHAIARGLRIFTFAGVGGLVGGLAVAGNYVFRSVAGIAAGTYMGKKIGTHFERNKGAKRAHNLLEGREGINDASVQSIRDLDTLYEKGSSDAIEKSRRKREAIAAVIFGAGVSYESALMLENLPAVNDAVVLAAHEVSKLPDEAHNIASSAMHEVEKLPSEIKHLKTDAIHQYESLTTPAGPQENVSAIYEAVVEKGQGSDVLFSNLKHTLQETYPDINNAPAIVQHLLRSNEHVLSTQYGFAKHGESALLQQGEKLEIQNNALVFVDDKGMSHILSQIKNGQLVSGEQFSNFDNHYTQDVIANLGAEHGSEVASNIGELSEAPVVVGDPALHGLVEKYGNNSMAEVLYGNIPVKSELHNALINAVSQSGVGPSNNETIEQFLSRARENVLEHVSNAKKFIGMNNLNIYDYQTHLYKTAGGDIVSFGGDFDAKSLMAYEYLSNHPGAHVLIENAKGTLAVNVTAVSSFAGRTITSSRPGVFIAPEQFAGRINP